MNAMPYTNTDRVRRQNAIRAYMRLTPLEETMEGLRRLGMALDDLARESGG